MLAQIYENNSPIYEDKFPMKFFKILFEIYKKKRKKKRRRLTTFYVHFCPLSPNFFIGNY